MHNQRKRHIALAFVVLMLFPFFNNSMHFLLNEHQYNFEQETETSISNSSSSHVCEQDLFSTSNYLDISFFEFKLINPRISQKTDFVCTNNIEKKVKQSNIIRGPPRIT